MVNYITYNKELTDNWRESNITLGNIPKIIEGINKAKIKI